MMKIHSCLIMWLSWPWKKVCLIFDLIEYKITFSRSKLLEVFLGKGVLKKCSKFTGEHPSQIKFSIKSQSNFIEITLRLVCSPVNAVHIFRTPFSKNTSGGLLLIQEETEKKSCVFSTLWNIYNGTFRFKKSLNIFAKKLHHRY